jgi:phage terminase large subunit
MITTNPTWYRIYTLGEFVSLGKLVYTNWERGFVPENKANLQILVGLDFGYSNDPSALIISYADVANKTIYVDREIYEKGLLNNMIYERILNQGVAKEVVSADSAEPKSIEELKRLGVPRIKAATKGPGSVNTGIQFLQQYKLIVNPSCVNTIEELENYAYKRDKSTGEYTNEPEDNFNHAMDSLRYSTQVLTKPNKLRMLPIGTL